MTVTPSFDLDSYLGRIGQQGAAAADAATLARVHAAHVGAIPFENLDVQAGRRIHLDLVSLQAKLVSRRRGGYCFEQNTLFRHALQALGFDVTPCEARVRPPGVGDPLPRTHMVLIVRTGGREWLCDVGFGGDGLFGPMPLDGAPVEQIDRWLRVALEGPLRVLQWRSSSGWEDLYAFLPEPRFPVDFEVGNWYTSTHPGSPFVRRLTVQRVLPDARHILRQLTYSVHRRDGSTSRDIARAELPRLLREVFGLDVEDLVFPAIDDVPVPQQGGAPT